MTMTIGGTSGLVFPDSSTQNTGASGFGFKNRIINGAMMIDQRNNGASVAVNNVALYTLDRWLVDEATDGAVSIQQITSAPAGFINALRVTVTTADASIGSTQYAELLHKIEGSNVADLGWGTANAQPVTVSFQVNSSVTGTFAGVLKNSAQNRSYPFTFTVNSANTWETKTITVAGDTTGTWLTNNGIGITLSFSLACGSSYQATAGSWTGGTVIGATGQTQLLSTLNATFSITGVQLEKGSTATSFDYRPYGTELALCQRYYQEVGYQMCGRAEATTLATITAPLMVKMRSAPTANLINTTNVLATFGVSAYTVSSITSAGYTDNGFKIAFITTGLTVGNIINGYSDRVLGLSAEL